MSAHDDTKKNHKVTFRKKQKSATGGKKYDKRKTSIELTLDKWEVVVRDAINDPVVALNLQAVRVLPEWLQDICAALGGTGHSDPSRNLAPKLRETLQEWLGNPLRAWEFLLSNAVWESSTCMIELAQLLLLRIPEAFRAQYAERNPGN